jgi:hypothetical protein
VKAVGGPVVRLTAFTGRIRACLFQEMREMPQPEIRIDFRNGGIWVEDPDCDDAFISLDQLAAWATQINEAMAGETIQLDYVMPSFPGGVPTFAGG